MALFAAISYTPFSLSLSRLRPPTNNRRFSPSLASVSSSSHESSPPSPPPSSPTETILSSNPPSKPLVESSRPLNSPFNYALPDPNASPVLRFIRSSESSIERVIFDFRFLALLAVGGSLAGSLLCFLNVNFLSSLGLEPGTFHKPSPSLYHLSQASRAVGLLLLFVVSVGKCQCSCFLLGCVYIVDAYKVYWTSCVKGIHTGKMVLRLVEAIDVYLAGTVMLIFGMGLYGLFISNVPPNVPPSVDRALKESSLFGMFALKERPKWMKISSLDELKTKVGHVIVMILLVKMFERSKMVTIATGMDLLSYSVCIFLSSASLYILNNLHKAD